MLTVQERGLLFIHCSEHAVASCGQCDADYRLMELAADVFRGLSHLCPKCREDLSPSTRDHLASCTVLRAQIADEGRRRVL
jgi:hypothetical protein